MINVTNQTSTSVLKSKAIYSDLLAKENYKWYQIDDLAITEFIEFEHERIGEPTELHLLAIKKILLYAIPVIAPRNSSNTRGITLTAQFNTDCIINNSSKDRQRLVNGDKYTLVGFAFFPELVNNIDFSSFEWKYYYKYPQEYIASEIDLTHLAGIKKQVLRHSEISQIYLIDTSHYEDVDLYNKILKLIKIKLDEYTYALTSIQNQCDETNHKDLEPYKPIPRIVPFNDTPIINKLNQILEKQIDSTFTLSYYDTLQATANWLLYNQIYLYGYDSAIVSAYLERLKYIKDENRKVFLQLAKEDQEHLEQTRAEKIAREQYPFYFSEIDRRGIFVRFNRFALNKLPKAHQAEIITLLDKELAYQRALIENKCPHIRIIKQLTSNPDIYKELEPFIDIDRKTDADHTYNCKNCTYPLLCEHEVEFYSNLLISKESADSNDQVYAIQQNIINKYKSIQQKNNDADMFSYFCKYCSQELGKNSDIIQVSLRDPVSYGHIQNENDEVRNMVYFTLANLLTTNVDPMVLQIDKKKVLRALLLPVKEQMDNIIHSFQKFKDEIKIEAHTRMSILIMSLCSLISLNINVLKNDKVLLHSEPIKKIKKVAERSSKAEETSETEEETSSESEEEPTPEQPSVTGGSIKHEFANAFAIIKNSSQYNALVISDDKIKAMLIDYYRKIAKDVGELVDVRSMIKSNEERLALDVSQSAIYAYAKYIVSRNKNTVANLPFETVMGTAITKIPAKDKSSITDYLYTKLPHDTTKNTDARARYIKESYKNIRSFLTDERYKGTAVEPDVDNFIKEYEAEQKKRLAYYTKNPGLYMFDINTRESEFELTNLNLIYCATTAELTKHKWVKNVCSICNVDYKKVSSSHNKHIEELINDNIIRGAFFDMYSINCPINNTHLFENNKCIQCGVDKQQLISHDMTYYKKYLKKFEDYRANILKQFLIKTNLIAQLMSYSSPPPPIIKQTEKSIEANIDQIALVISKVFEVKQSDLMELSGEYLDSYLKLVYERYVYAKNVSYDMSKHPDIEFYDLIRTNFFKGTNPIKIKMEELPPYDYQNYEKDTKLYQLLQLFDIMIKQNLQPVIMLGKFLVKRIISQESRRKEFNFAKLKSSKPEAIEEEDIGLEVTIDENEEDNDESDTSLFMAYDIDMDDMDDNIEGDLD